MFDCGFSPPPSLLLRRFSVLVEPLADLLFLNYSRGRERRGKEREEERKEEGEGEREAGGMNNCKEGVQCSYMLYTHRLRTCAGI